MCIIWKKTCGLLTLIHTTPKFILKAAVYMSKRQNIELIETVDFKLFKSILDEGDEFTVNHLL